MQPGTRLHHLDGLRGFCMIFGLFVHGATIGDTWLFTLVKDASDLFRMAAFFLVSGYFTAMMAERLDARGYAANRALLIGLPLATALVLIAPVTCWLIDSWHNWPVGFGDWLGGARHAMTAGNAVWHLQFWFLFSLAFYAAGTPALMRLLRAAGAPAAIDRLMAPRTALPLLGLATGVALALLMAANELVVQPLLRGTPFAFIARASLNYAPYFLLGVAAFAARGLFARLHQPPWIAWVAAAVAWGLLVWWRDALPREIGGIATWTARGALILFNITILLWIAGRLIRGPSRLLGWVTGSAYSFYLLHMTYVFALAHLLRPLTDSLHLIYLVTLVTGIPFLVWLHVGVIARSPALMLLLNGRPRRRAVVAETLPKGG